MAGLPTLDGIKELQVFLAKNGIELPIYQLEIYSERDSIIGVGLSNNLVPTKVIKVPLYRYLRIDGKNHPVIDKRISSKDGKSYLRFRDPMKCHLSIKFRAIINNEDCYLEISDNLKSFINKHKAQVIKILTTKL